MQAHMSDEMQQRMARRAILTINGRAWGVATGLLAALTLFVATIVLVLKGGENVGQHLQLLSVFFPGYSVSFVGSLIGAVYCFVLGYGLGRVIGFVYNWTAGIHE